jgi:membrane protein YqaA with SNARE-associated domain
MFLEQFLQWLQQPQVGLVGVAIAAFVAATMLPLASELVLLGYVAWQPDKLWLALIIAIAFNTAGGMTTYALGRYGARFLSHTKVNDDLQRWHITLHRSGAVLTSLGWLPVLGDGLVLAAGALRLPALPCVLWQLLGRGLRYAAVLGILKAWLP